jgi:hypothetical protein
MTGRPGIDGYLSEVAAVLPGPARARDDIIAELRSGLLDAADAYRAAGHSPDEATAAATAEFGDPRQIAAGFGPELAARESRRLARDLIITGPLVGLLWVAAATASHVGIRHAPPWQWRGMPPASLIAVPLFGAVLLTFVCAALVTLAATGSLTRWLPSSPRTATGTAAIAGFAAAAADLAVFTLLASKLASTPAALAPAPVLAAAIASLTRITLARRAARRCLTARAALSRALHGEPSAPDDLSVHGGADPEPRRPYPRNPARRPGRGRLCRHGGGGRAARRRVGGYPGPATP